jgi:F-type H+-transporting ATPase subunit delta
MADLQAARRYAQAAFAIASDSNTVGTWRAELQDVAEVLTDSRAAAVFADARLPLERREAMLERTLDVSPLVMNLAKLLVAKGRAPEARAVAEAFSRIADEAAGIAHAEITTAVPLADERLRAIEGQLSRSLGKNVDAVGAVDPSIIGGIVVRVGDRLVDGSIRTRLKKLREELQGAR